MKPSFGAEKRPLLLYVVNNPAFFLSHRINLGLAARNSGYDVFVAGPKMEEGLSQIKEIEGHGFSYISLPLSRRGMNPLTEIQAIFALFRLFRRLEPDLIHLLTIKPVLYGGIAARFARLGRVVVTITGMGYLYTSPSPLIRIIQAMVNSGYRFALRWPAVSVIFQNSEDQNYFLGKNLVRKSQTHLIRGSGVDLDKFLLQPEPPDSDQTPIILLGARMLWDKGIGEFVEAAKTVKSTFPGARFVLAGPLDSGNPASIPDSKLKEWQKDGIVEWIGPSKNMSELLKKATLACLPSYREGLPLFLLEAMATGRAVITNDVIGCRELVETERTGLLVQPRNSKSLAEAILKLLHQPELRHRLASAGRDEVVQKFSLKKVIRDTLAVYDHKAT